MHMMKFTSAIKREVEDKSEGTLVVELTAVGIYIKKKGTRTTYGPVSWGSVFYQGAKMQAIADMKVRRA